MKLTVALLVGAALAATLVAADPRPANTLAAGEAEAGWVLLFDGKSTDQFRGYRQPDFPTQGWAVVDGTLQRVAGPAGGDIITREQYGDFEFVCEWRIAPGGNSGIIYRCTEDHMYPWETGPEMQILDDEAHGDGASPRTRAGSLYDLFPCAEAAVKPAGEWNEVRIIAKGPHIQQFLNGVKVVDIRLDSEEYREAHAASKWTAMPDFGKRARGHIALQDHGDEVWFRNIRVRSLD